MAELRIVAVNKHDDSGEIEIILEEERGMFQERVLHSTWLTVEEIRDHKNTTTFKLEG